MDSSELDSLVADAQRLGLDSKERIIDHLNGMIDDAQKYLEYRSRKNRNGAYNKTVARNAAALAMAIKFLSEH